MSSIVLDSQTVQVTTEAKARPTMTAFTTMSADANMPHGLRSRGSCPAESISWANAELLATSAIASATTALTRCSLSRNHSLHRELIGVRALVMLLEPRVCKYPYADTRHQHLVLGVRDVIAD